MVSKAESEAQNGDRIVTINSVMSLNPMYGRTSLCFIS